MLGDDESNRKQGSLIKSSQASTNSFFFFLAVEQTNTPSIIRQDSAFHDIRIYTLSIAIVPPPYSVHFYTE